MHGKVAGGCGKRHSQAPLQTSRQPTTPLKPHIRAPHSLTQGPRRGKHRLGKDLEGGGRLGLWCGLSLRLRQDAQASATAITAAIAIGWQVKRGGSGWQCSSSRRRPGRHTHPPELRKRHRVAPAAPRRRQLQHAAKPRVGSAATAVAATALPADSPRPRPRPPSHCRGRQFALAAAVAAELEVWALQRQRRRRRGQAAGLASAGGVQRRRGVPRPHRWWVCSW